MWLSVPALVCFGIGIFVLRANSRRFLNQVFLGLTFFIGVWLLLVVQGAVEAFGQQTGFPWHRANAAVAALFPWALWLLTKSIEANEGKALQTIRHSLPWFGLSCLLGLLAYTDSFIFLDSESGRLRRGTSYFIYGIAEIFWYFYLMQQAFLKMHKQIGLQRVETQILGLILGTTFGLGATAAVAGNFFQLHLIKASSLYIILGSLILSAWVITTHYIMDVCQIFFFLTRLLFVGLIFCFATFGLWHFYGSFREPFFDFFWSFVLVSFLVFWLDRKSRGWIDRNSEKNLAETRRSVIDIAHKEAYPEKLIFEFEALLRRRLPIDFVALLSGNGESPVSMLPKFDGYYLGYKKLCEMGWATQESLERRHSDPALSNLLQFLRSNNLGLVVAVPKESEVPSLVVALGVKNDKRFFTYPEVKKIQNVAELMDNILTRARLAEQAATQARVEHLAMMSRGLAHDLKNLITPVSSFLIHTDGSFTIGSPEAEVHFAARRSVRIMTDYIREALFFSERFAPHFEQVDLDKVFDDVRQLTAARAEHRKVFVSIASGCHEPVWADAVLLQRLLGNLITNAIDASASGQNVAISSSIGRPGWLRLQITDQGCGIAPEHLARIFDPYFTTKEFGDDVRGFGLGLTICQKIVHLHGGKISAESQLDRGATFTVDLPIAQKQVCTEAILAGEQATQR